MGFIIHNYLEYPEDEEGNKDDKGLVGNQEKLFYKAIKMKKSES